MRLQILPKDTINIPTSRTKEFVIEALNKSFGQAKDKRLIFWSTQSYFEIQKTVRNSSRSKIIAKGRIQTDKEKNILTLDISTQDTYLKFLAFIWYGINALLFIFFMYVIFESGDFTFIVLMPLLFIFLGYGFTTASLQSEIDQIISEVKRLTK